MLDKQERAIVNVDEVIPQIIQQEIKPDNGHEVLSPLGTKSQEVRQYFYFYNNKIMIKHFYL